MDKPVPFWLVFFTAVILAAGSVGIYFWLKSLIIKDKNDNIKRSN